MLLTSMRSGASERVLIPGEDVWPGSAHGRSDDLEVAWVTREDMLAQRGTQEDEVGVDDIAAAAPCEQCAHGTAVV